MNDPLHLRPKKSTFLFSRVTLGLVGAALIATFVTFALRDLTPNHALFGLLVFAAIATFTVVASAAAYRKERYEIHPTHIRCRRGGLLSDQTVELDVRNITHVKIQLPWLRHKLFGIGHILIESAGTSQPAVLRYIKGPEAVYETVRDRMRDNGYALGQRELLVEDRPALIAVALDCLGVIIATPFAILAAVSFLEPLIAVVPDDSDLRDPENLGAIATSPEAAIVALTLAAVGLLVLVIRFLDLRRRTYRVYDDVVVYTEGFLTRENAFIPYENIADAETKRTLIDNILGLFDVQISCQGSGAEIKFRRLRRGIAVSAAIDDLVARARQKPNPRDTAVAPREPGAPPAPPTAAHPVLPPVPGDQAWTAELRMSGVRVILPLLILIPLVPVWLIATIRAIIVLSATSYAVKQGSVRHSYRFLRTDEREFAYEKITGLIIRRNLWDRLFKTVTVTFWSIGSGRAMHLAHVKERDINLAALKRQVGIPEPSTAPLAAPASFNPARFLAANLIPLSILAVVAVAVPVAVAFLDEPSLLPVGYTVPAVLAVLTAIAFLRSWLYHNRQTLEFHPHHVESRQGILSVSHYHACYRHIKKTLLTRYPGGDAGKLQVFVAGEQEAVRSNPGQANNAKVRKPCSFTTRYHTGIAEKQQLVDDLIAARVPAAPDAAPAEPFECVAESRRATGNTVVLTLLLAIIPPLLVVLPVTLPLFIIATRRYRYRVESGRVVATWGILYHKHASVLLDRIDSIRHNQGPLNKMFRNGTVSLMTAGSSQPELVLDNAHGHTALYDEIRRRSSTG